MTDHQERGLQDASSEKKEDEQYDDNLFFPYAVSSLVCLGVAWILFKIAYIYVLKRFFGWEKPLSGEEILANLSEEERRAVLQSILSQFSKVRTNGRGRL